jgi:hypothetical protein
MLTLGSLVSRLLKIEAVSLIFICVLVFQPYGRSLAYTKGIPEAAAVHLLRTYLRSQGYDTKKYPLDIERNEGDNSEKGFYLYYVYVDTPERLVTIGFYGVNAETGDIWEGIGCKRLESTAVASLQKQIRDASGLSASELERLRNTNPCI